MWLGSLHTVSHSIYIPRRSCDIQAKVEDSMAFKKKSDRANKNYRTEVYVACCFNDSAIEDLMLYLT